MIVTCYICVVFESHLNDINTIATLIINKSSRNNISLSDIKNTAKQIIKYRQETIYNLHICCMFASLKISH